MKKRIVIPTYNDREKTHGWEHPYLDSPNHEVVYYDKDDSLPPFTDSQISDGWRIPNFGRSSFAFLWHIVKNYDSLADVEIFTKTHLWVQRIDIHRTVDDSHNHLHLQAYNTCRGFLMLDSTNKEHLEMLDRACASNSFIRTHEETYEFSSVAIDDFRFPFPVLWAKEDSHVKLPMMFVHPRDPVKKADYLPYPALRECFDDWVQPNPYYLRRENVWAVRKEVILANPRSLYEMMLTKIQEGSETWSMFHDAWCEFWPLFWHETIQRSFNSDALGIEKAQLDVP